MKELEQDNDTWTPLGLAAARVLAKCEEQSPDGQNDQAPGKEIDKQREKQRFVETRLREIERFERRYRNDRA